MRGRGQLGVLHLHFAFQENGTLKLFVTLLEAAFQIVEPLSPHCTDASPDA
jgi:hypothetical protein